MTLKLLDTVVLTHDIPAHGLRAGDIGAVVDVYDDSVEVEFVSGGGRTQAVLTLGLDEFRAIGDGDLLAVRPLAHSV
jgi:hypothetical protein